MAEYGVFKEVKEPHGTYLKHQNGIHFIGHYDPPGVPEFWHAYKAVLPVPEGRQPWTIDNRRIGGKCFKLADAKKIITDEVKADLEQKIEEKRRANKR